MPPLTRDRASMIAAGSPAPATPRRSVNYSARRSSAVAVVGASAIALPLAFGHRGTHAILNLVLPGGGLFGVNTAAAIAFLALIVVVVGMWMRWGVDWLVIVVAVAAMAVSAFSIHDHEPVETAMRSIEIDRAAHEFPLVLLVVGALSRLGRLVRRLPPVAALHRRRATQAGGFATLHRLAPVARCQAASIAVLAGVELEEQATVAPAVARSDVARRARHVGMIARGRLGGDPFRVDHAHARTALALTGQLTPSALSRFVADGEGAPARVPCSEPTWIRPLDATLAAAALHRLGRVDAIEISRILFQDRLPLRRGRRPAFWWTVLGVHAGACPDWEHAASTAIARALGAVGDDDWHALRRRALGAAARGTTHPHDERLIAAARIWLNFVADTEARRIIDRPTVRHDPLAVALDRLASRLQTDPEALTRPVADASMVR